MKTITSIPVRSLGSVGIALEQIPVFQRGKYKSQQFAQLKITEFTHKGWDVRIVGKIREYEGYLYVSVLASYQGNPVIVDNPLIYKNPPILVPDGTVHMETVKGQETEVPNYKEDLTEALKEIIVETLRVTHSV